MSTIRDQIVAAVFAALNGPDKPAGINVRRFSLTRIEPDQMPMIEVYPHKDVAIETKPMAVRRTLTVGFDVYAAGELVDQEIDPALAWITSALQAAPRSLGGLATDIREGQAEWDGEAALSGIGLCKAYVEIDYIHNRTNQETKP